MKKRVCFSRKMLAMIISLAMVITCAVPLTAFADYDWSEVGYDFDDPVVMTPGVTRNVKFTGDSDWYVFEAAGGEYTVTVYSKTKFSTTGGYRLPVFFSYIREISKSGLMNSGDPEESLGMFYVYDSDVPSDGWYAVTETIGTFEKGTIVGIELERLNIPSGSKVIGNNPYGGEYKVCINGKVAASAYKPGKTKIKSIGIGKKASLTINWKKANKASGYQVRCALNKKFTKGVKKATIKKGTTLKKKIKKLKRKKKYYVKVRAYRMVNGKTYYGPWSAVKSAKTR